MKAPQENNLEIDSDLPQQLRARVKKGLSTEGIADPTFEENLPKFLKVGRSESRPSPDLPRELRSNKKRETN